MNADDTLQAQAVAVLNTSLAQPDEVSALAVFIDPVQNVASTSHLAVLVNR